MPELLRPEMRGRQVKSGVWEELYVGTGGRTQSLARMNLGHEPELPEVLREIFGAETMKKSDTPGRSLKLTRSGTDSQ